MLLSEAIEFSLDFSKDRVFSFEGLEASELSLFETVVMCSYLACLFFSISLLTLQKTL